jgi:hypothetical protein
MGMDNSAFISGANNQIEWRVTVSKHTFGLSDALQFQIHHVQPIDPKLVITGVSVGVRQDVTLIADGKKKIVQKFLCKPDMKGKVKTEAAVVAKKGGFLGFVGGGVKGEVRWTGAVSCVVESTRLKKGKDLKTAVDALADYETPNFQALNEALGGDSLHASLSQLSLTSMSSRSPSNNPSIISAPSSPASRPVSPPTSPSSRLSLPSPSSPSSPSSSTTTPVSPPPSQGAYTAAAAEIHTPKPTPPLGIAYSIQHAFVLFVSLKGFAEPLIFEVPSVFIDADSDTREWVLRNQRTIDGGMRGVRQSYRMEVFAE